jgi:hypothetical protein
MEEILPIVLLIVADVDDHGSLPDQGGIGEAWPDCVS